MTKNEPDNGAQIADFAQRVAITVEQKIDEMIFSKLPELHNLKGGGDKKLSELVAIAVIYERIGARIFAQTRVIQQRLKQAGAGSKEIENLKKLRKEFRIIQSTKLRKALHERAEGDDGEADV